MDWNNIGAGAISTGVNTLFGLASNQVQYNQQKKLMAKQYQYQKDFYDYTNNLNSPENQVERLKKAGLNPALAHGTVQNVGGTTGSMPNAKGPDLKTGQLDLLRAEELNVLQKNSDSQTEVNNSIIEANKAKAQKDFVASLEGVWQYLSPEERKEYAREIADGQFYENEYKNSISHQAKVMSAFYYESALNKIVERDKISTEVQNLLVQRSLLGANIEKVFKEIEALDTEKKKNEALYCYIMANKDLVEKTSEGQEVLNKINSKTEKDWVNMRNAEYEKIASEVYKNMSTPTSVSGPFGVGASGTTRPHKSYSPRFVLPSQVE